MHYHHHVFCCKAQRPEGHPKPGCGNRKGEDFYNYMKQRASEMELLGIRINSAGCMGRCDEGPVVVVYPEGIWYRPQNLGDMDEILTSHIQGNKPVKRLMLD
jgi:(2Fe-2S) ferredoxin